MNITDTGQGGLSNAITVSLEHYTAVEYNFVQRSIW